MKHSILVLLIVLSVLCFGVLIYATTRTEALYLNQWTSLLSGNTLKPFFQPFITYLSFPGWIIYSLPDGLWMLALMMLMMMIWNFKFNHKSLPWLACAFFTGILFETFQGLQWISGTFDINDIYCLCLGAFIPISFTLLKSRVCKTA